MLKKLLFFSAIGYKWMGLQLLATSLPIVDEIVDIDKN
jgi:hypothetical protein